MLSRWVIGRTEKSESKKLARRTENDVLGASQIIVLERDALRDSYLVSEK
jgi:hypothetical protein